MKINNSQKLKQLQTRKVKLQLDLKVLTSDQQLAQQNYQKAKNQLQSVRDQIEDISTKEIIVTEHAMLRYFERVLGFDLEDVKNEILTEKILKQFEILGNGKISYT